MFEDLQTRMLALAGAAPPTETSDWADLISGTIKPTFHNNLLEVMFDLQPIGQATVILTYGMTVAVKAPIGQVEGRALGYNSGTGLRAGTGLWVQLPKGQYQATWIALVSVRLTDTHWAMPMNTGKFAFEVQ